MQESNKFNKPVVHVIAPEKPFVSGGGILPESNEPEKKKSRGRAIIASIAGLTLVAGGVAVGANIMNNSGAQEPGGEPTSEPTNGSEVVPEVGYEEEIAANIAERPALGSPEYQALVDSFSIDASEYTTGEDAALGFGKTIVQKVWTAGFNEVPADFYTQAIALSIDEMVEKMQPDYWSEVTSQAIFGKTSTELSPEQKVLFDSMVTDYKLFLRQRILTSAEERPTNPVVTEDSVSLDVDSPALLNGVYEYTFWPNEGNSIANFDGPNNNDAAPRTQQIGFTLELDPTTNDWYLIDKDI